MKEISLGHFFGKIQDKKEHSPLSGQIELTYRCNFNCIHCYCKDSEDLNKELTTQEWKNILDQIHKEGCLWLCMTGGDPLVRDDFRAIYSYAKQKGFIISLFTNGQAFNEQIIDFLANSPPFSIEITLNGMTQGTYESITRVPGSFLRVIGNIKKIADRKLKLILKVNCLKQNKQEVGKIKAFTEDLLGKPSANKHYFKYDPMIYPRLNKDKTPCDHRLSFGELLEVKKQDPEIWKEYQKGLHADLSDPRRDLGFLYRCNSWMSQFFINPYGKLKFCNFSDKFSIDLKTTPFKQGFYNWPAQILSQRFKTESKCKNCSLRILCYHCPGRAYLETGDEEAPVEYYCRLAEGIAKDIRNVNGIKKGEESALQ